MQTWRRFWRMSGSARAGVLEAAAGLVMTRAGLHLLGFRRWQATVEWLTRPAVADAEPAGPARIEFVRVLEQCATAAARHLPLGTTCLDRSMTLWWMLRRRGIAAELRIGGRKENGKFEAHAWVETAGVMLDGGANDGGEFAKFERPAAAMGMRAS